MVEEVDLTENHIVDIHIHITGNALVLVNDDPINDGDPKNKVTLTLEHEGDVMVTINGEDFQIGKEQS
jgi:hypothetical protein